MKSKKIRYAVVGLGHIAQTAVLPAFKHAKNSELVALVSSDLTKLKKLGKKYDVDHLYSYENYDELLQSELIDAVYIALPNHLHKDYSIRASKAGVHVLCEKPMALNTIECEEMIQAAKEANSQLMIAYRLHFEESNLKAIELAKSEKLGDLRFFNSTFGFTPKEGNIRLLDKTGGGPLYDIGPYCINAARYLFQDEPTEVVAFATQSDRKKLREVEESITAIMRFPEERIASFTVSFGCAPVGNYHLVGTKGDLFVENGYDYTGEITHRVTVRGKTKEKVYKPRDQFAPELIYFSDCILKQKTPEPSGLEGYADIRIIEAIYRSIETRTPIKLVDFHKEQRPGLKQEITKKKIKQPKPIHAEDPSGEAA